MKVFKFGGASVKDAEGVKNVARILEKYGSGELVIIISAMGKTTNALESILNSYWEGREFVSQIQALKKYHIDIVQGLFPSGSKEQFEVGADIENDFIFIEHFFSKSLEHNYDFIYDQIVPYGELVSTKIVSWYLNHFGYRNKWVDARNFIITDQLYREARVDWDATLALIQRQVPEMIKTAPVLTQGFIGAAKDNHTTTLGREGSDYTASIFANALNAENVVIWKDVPGVMNADPKKFPDAVKFDKLSYREAIEMTYYGATVIHPKTIQPLQQKNIPLHVQSFIEPEAAGTIITAEDIKIEVPITIVKSNQSLVSIASKELSFITEKSLEEIFSKVVESNIKVNLMQNSAISFSIVIDSDQNKIAAFSKSLSDKYAVRHNDNLELITIRHYAQSNIDSMIQKEGKHIFLEKKSRNTIHLLMGGK